MQNRSAVQNSGALAVTAAVLSALNGDQYKTGDEHWPDDAVYAARYSLKAWPSQANDYVRFFRDAEEFKTWYAKKLKWATLEDNYFTLDYVFEWDWGPQLKAQGWLPFDRYSIDLSTVGWDY